MQASDIYEKYSEIYKDITQNQYIYLRGCPANDKLVFKFIKLINEYKPDADLIFASSIIRFNISDRLETSILFKGKVMPSWILGEAAIKRFMTTHNYRKEKIRLKAERIKTKSMKSNLFSPSLIEESYKRKFYDTKYCFYFCADMTTLYHPLSEYCVSCKFQETCKIEQKKHYPLIYKSRNK